MSEISNERMSEFPALRTAIPLIRQRNPIGNLWGVVLKIDYTGSWPILQDVGQSLINLPINGSFVL